MSSAPNMTLAPLTRSKAATKTKAVPANGGALEAAPMTGGGSWSPGSSLSCPKPGEPKTPQVPHTGPKKARVVWVGNIPPTVHHDELREAFRCALDGELADQGLRVTHVNMRYQKKQPFNSATIFFNRSVNLALLGEGLIRERRPMLTIRKCLSKRRFKRRRAYGRGRLNGWSRTSGLPLPRAAPRSAPRHTTKSKAPAPAPAVAVPPPLPKNWVPPASDPSSPYSIANRDAEAFMNKQSSPPPTEIAPGTFMDFVKELDEGREPMDIILRTCQASI